MKSLALIATASLLFASAQASVWDTVGGTISDFFGNAPTNNWDVTVFSVYVPHKVDTENVKPYEFGGGLGVSYWLTPNVGAELAGDWTPSGVTLTSVSFSGRGTINFGKSITVSPFVGLGVGYVFQQPNDPSPVIAVAEGGVALAIKGLPVKFVGSYQYFTTDEPFERIKLGIRYSF